MIVVPDAYTVYMVDALWKFSIKSMYTMHSKSPCDVEGNVNTVDYCWKNEPRMNLNHQLMKSLFSDKSDTLVDVHCSSYANRCLPSLQCSSFTVLPSLFERQETTSEMEIKTW